MSFQRRFCQSLSSFQKVHDRAIHVLLISSACVVTQFLGSCAEAGPTVLGYGHHTDRYAPHSISGWPQGDSVQIAVGISSSDAPGSSSIVVQAKQGDTTVTLDWYSLPATIYPTPHLYYKFLDLDPLLTGPWEIIPTDSTGTGPSTFTNAIADPEFLPLAENVTTEGTPFGSSVSWTVPDLTGFDVEYVQVRIVQVSPLAEVYMSDFMPVQTTSFQAPPGILQVGVEYAYQVSLEDTEGYYEENRSNTLSEVFRYAPPGDFNFDGKVDGNDFLLWQRGGSRNPYSAADLSEWEAHYGSTTPISESTAVPEPVSSAALALGCLSLLAVRGRREAQMAGYRPLARGKGSRSVEPSVWQT